MIPRLLITLVAALHLYFAAFEMLWWTKPRGRRAFGLSVDFANATRALAANQGLYNLFLVAGLGWGLAHPDPSFGRQIEFFTLSCILAAGLFGALTVSRRILWVQAAPALAAIASLIIE